MRNPSHRLIINIWDEIEGILLGDENLQEKLLLTIGMINCITIAQLGDLKRAVAVMCRSFGKNN